MGIGKSQRDITAPRSSTEDQVLVNTTADWQNFVFANVYYRASYTFVKEIHL